MDHPEAAEVEAVAAEEDMLPDHLAVVVDTPAEDPAAADMLPDHPEAAVDTLAAVAAEEDMLLLHLEVVVVDTPAAVDHPTALDPLSEVVVAVADTTPDPLQLLLPNNPTLPQPQLPQPEAHTEPAVVEVADKVEATLKVAENTKKPTQLFVILLVFLCLYIEPIPRKMIINKDG